MGDNQKRIPFIDLAKGICITLVVFYHSKGVLHCNYLTDSFLMSFRLPLYFFLSGLFFKDYGNFRTFFIKKTNRLLIPFFFFYLCFSVLIPNVMHYCLGMNFETVLGLPSLWAFIWPGQYPNIPIWFLLCLFLMNIYFWIVRKMVKESSIFLLIICIISGITGYWLINHYESDYGNLFKALQSIPFFYFGYLFAHYEGLSVLQSLSKKRSIVCLFIFLIPTFILSVFIPWPTIITFYICGISGTLFILLLAVLFQYLPLLSYIGRYSIIILLTHGIFIRILTPLYQYLNQSISATSTIVIMTLLLLLSYYIIIPLMCRYFPYVTAQRPLIKE